MNGIIWGHTMVNGQVSEKNGEITKRLKCGGTWGVTLYQHRRSAASAFYWLTLLILLLLSAVRNDMLLISFITTKFCSSRLKFCNREKKKKTGHVTWRMWAATNGCIQRQNKNTHVGFGPENKDLSHHSEQFLCVWVWACQPPCSVLNKCIMLQFWQ